MKREFIFDLKPGMVIGKDCLTTNGIMIVPAGVMLTQAIIDHLKALGVFDVYIDESAHEDAFIKKNDEEFNVNVGEEFEEFNRRYMQGKDELNNTFGKIIRETPDKKEIEHLIDESWKLIDKGTNSYDMLGMLYSMHTYSDSTYMHCLNVGMIAALIGKWLGWPEEDLRILNACGLFHDIGKLLIPHEILDKPCKLSDSEYKIMKTHTIKGYELMKKVDIDSCIANAALMHHERCDGSGYPLGLKGDKIDRFSKVLGIADVYEAMTANRVYRGPVCPFDVVAQFENSGFGLYETEYLLVFLQNILDSYLHTKVKLNNGEKAEIVLINRQRGSKPVVITSGGKAVDLSKETNLKISKIYE